MKTVKAISEKTSWDHIVDDRKKRLPLLKIKYQLTPLDLIMPYHNWKEFVDCCREYFDSVDLEWLKDWDDYDLAVSPWSDEQRQVARCFHHNGWFACYMRRRKVKL